MADKVVSISLTPEAETLLKKLRISLDPDVFRKEIVKLFDKLSASVAGFIVKNLLSGQLVYRRTGMLARSIVGRGVLVNGVPAIRVGIFTGPALKYAGVIDQGTKGVNASSPYPTIRPSEAKALAIPVNDSLTPAGVARYQGPRGDPRKLVYGPPPKFTGPPEADRIASNKVFAALYDKSQISKDITAAKAAYLLMMQVDIKPRFYFMTGMLKALPEISQKTSDFLVARFS